MTLACSDVKPELQRAALSDGFLTSNSSTKQAWAQGFRTRKGPGFGFPKPSVVYSDFYPIALKHAFYALKYAPFGGFL